MIYGNVKFELSIEMFCFYYIITYSCNSAFSKKKCTRDVVKRFNLTIR